MDRWDVVIIIVAGYVAVIALMRLMVARRNQVIKQVREQIQRQRVTPPEANPENQDSDRGAA